MTWWTDYQVRRGVDRKTLFTDNMKNLVSTEFENSTSYNLVKISGVNKKTRIVEENSIIKNPNRKRLLCFPNETINIGEPVEYDDSNWICVNNDTTSNISDVGIIERCNNTFPFYDSASTLHTIHCIVTKGLISLDEQKIISTLDSEIAVQINDTSITRQIEINNVFRIGLRNYKITDINDITILGLLLLKMVYSEVEQQIPIFTLEILNGNSIQVNENDSLTINVQVKIDGIIASPMPSLLFESSDITKATINSSTGVVTILDVGSVNFSCKMVNDLTVMDTISVEIVEVPQEENITYTLIGNSQPDNLIKYNQTKTYVSRKYNNGIEVENINFTFSIIADSTPLNAYQLNLIDNNSCSVKALKYGYNISLRVTDGDNYIDKSIQLKSLL